MCFFRDFYQNIFLPKPTPELPPGNEKWDSLRIQAHTFHGTRRLNSWGLLEVRIYDPAGKRIKVRKVETSSCWAECKGDESARSENLIDDRTALQTTEEGVFWAPTENIPDDAKEWVKFHFDESRVGVVEIHQWFEGGCMKDCTEENKKAGGAKIRSYAKDVLVSLYKGKPISKDAAYWLALNHDRIVTSEIPYP